MPRARSFPYVGEIGVSTTYDARGAADQDQDPDQRDESRPLGRTTYTWNQESRLLGRQPNYDELSRRRAALAPLEDEQELRMAWDSQGTSGYQSLLEENQP